MTKVIPLVTEYYLHWLLDYMILENVESCIDLSGQVWYIDQVEGLLMQKEGVTV